MKDLIKRNLPVVIIGGIFVIVFLAIILISMRGDNNGPLPTFVSINEEEAPQGLVDESLLDPPSLDESENTPWAPEKEQPYDPAKDDWEYDKEEIELYSQRDEILAGMRLTKEETQAKHGKKEIYFGEAGFEPRQSRSWPPILLCETN